MLQLLNLNMKLITVRSTYLFLAWLSLLLHVLHSTLRGHSDPQSLADSGRLADEPLGQLAQWA